MHHKWTCFRSEWSPPKSMDSNESIQNFTGSSKFTRTRRSRKKKSQHSKRHAKIPSPVFQSRQMWTRDQDISPISKDAPPISSNVPFWKKTLKYFWILLCLSGLLYHSAVTTIKYFKYEVMSSTVYEFETKILLPSASICYDIGRIRIPTKFPEEHPCRGPLTKETNMSAMALHDPLRQQCEDILMKDHSYTEVHNNLTWDLLETFTLAFTKHMQKIIWFDKKPATEMPDRFKQFYKPPMKCLKVTWEEYEEFNLLNSTSQYLVIFLASEEDRIESNRIPYWGDRSGPLYVYLNDAYSYPKGRDQPEFIMDYCGEVTLSFRPYRIEYLPPPFRFACRNYDSLNKSNSIRRREDCIENCIRNANPDTLLTQYTFTHFPANDSRKLVRNKTLYNIFNDKCSKKCPLSCSTTIFETSENIVSIPWRPASFWMRHDQMSFKTKFNQRFPLIEYILFIASILGLWIPFSVFSSTIYIARSVSRISTELSENPEPTSTILMKFKQYSKILLRVICFLAFIYHSVDLTIEYSLYKTNTIITISDERDVPSVSLCESFVWLWGQNAAVTRWQLDQWERALFEEPVHDLLFKTENMTITGIGVNTGQGLHYYTSRGGWNGDPEFIKNQTELYVHNAKKCVSFNYPQNYRLNHTDIAHMWAQAMGFRIQKRERRYVEFNLYVHDGRIARGMILPSLDYKPGDIKRYVISSYETHYLPAPFSHGCHNYTEKGLESSYGCFEKCVDNHWLKYSPSHMAIQMTYSARELMDPKNRHRKYLKAVPMLDLNTICHTRCPVDCITKQYQTSYRSSHWNYNRPFEIYIELSGLKTHIQYSQTMPFYAYLVLLSGVVGLWFGSSIYSLSQDFGQIGYIVMKNYRIGKKARKWLKKMQKQIKNCLLFIISILMTTHVIFMTLEYLKYETETEVVAEYDQNYKAPEESICWDLTDVLIREEMPENSFCLRENINVPDRYKESCWNELISNFSLDHLMNKLTRDPINSVVELTIFDNERDELKTIPNNEYKQYLSVFYKHPYKCLQARYAPKNYDYVVKYDKIIKHRYGIFYNIMINSTQILASNRFVNIRTFISPQHHYPLVLQIESEIRCIRTQSLQDLWIKFNPINIIASSCNTMQRIFKATIQIKRWMHSSLYRDQTKKSW